MGTERDDLAAWIIRGNELNENCNHKTWLTIWGIKRATCGITQDRCLEEICPLWTAKDPGLIMVLKERKQS